MLIIVFVVKNDLTTHRPKDKNQVGEKNCNKRGEEKREMTNPAKRRSKCGRDITAGKEWA